VRGFTGAYYETYVRTGKGLPVLTEKQNYTTVCSYHCERIHNGIYITMKPTSELKKDF
jgi:hypothetical protein